MKKILKYILPIVFIVLATSGCNKEDDINAIFANRTWYVINLMSNSKESALSNAQFQTLYKRSDTYFIKFTTTGNFSVTTTSGSSYSGTCHIVGKKQSITFDLGNASGTEFISNTIIDWMKNTTSYVGDTEQLELHQKDSSTFIVLGKKR